MLVGWLVGQSVTLSLAATHQCFVDSFVANVAGVGTDACVVFEHANTNELQSTVWAIVVDGYTRDSHKQLG